MTDTKTEGTQLTDFSHLHELEERAKRTQSQMMRVQKNDSEWNQLAIQLFQTEQEIADERQFLGLTDMSTNELYAEIFDDHESEVAMQITEQAKEPLTEEIVNTELASLKFALAERNRLDPDAPKAIAFKESSDSEQLRNTQNALRNLYKAVQKSRAVNDPLGMATAMEEAGRWF